MRENEALEGCTRPEQKNSGGILHYLVKVTLACLPGPFSDAQNAGS